MSMSVIPFTAKLVKFDTDLPCAEVISRLKIAVNEEGAGNAIERLKTAHTQDELTAVVSDTAGDSGFLCVQFSILSFLNQFYQHGRHKVFHGFQVPKRDARMHGPR